MKKYNLIIACTLIYSFTPYTPLNAMLPSVFQIGNLSIDVQQKIRQDVLQFFDTIDCSKCKNQYEIDTTLATTWGHSKHKPASYQGEINSAACNEEGADVYSVLDSIMERTLQVAVAQKCKERGIEYIKD